jgi:hypothetical protein
MDEQEKNTEVADAGQANIRDIIRGAIQEFVSQERSKSEPAYKAELADERRRREQLERRVNELAEENRRNQMMAEEVQRHAAIRSELQKLGVNKVDLAFKAVKDDIIRSEDGRLVSRDAQDTGMRDYLTLFVNENPELLPARIAGGSGAVGAQKQPVQTGGFDLDRIKPGMSAEDLDRVRQEISRIASKTVRGN